MMVGVERVLLGHPTQREVELPFDVVGEGEVTHRAAVGADQMVVMFGQVFGQLVSSELVGRDDAVDHPGLLEYPEVAIGRGLRQRRLAFEDAGDRQGSIDGGQHIDQRLTPTRIALIQYRQPAGGDLVQVIVRHPPEDTGPSCAARAPKAFASRIGGDSIPGVIPISIPTPGPGRMRRPGRRRLAAAVVALGLVAVSCGDDAGSANSPAGPHIVVTYSILGSLVREAVGSSAQVDVLIPNGADPHEWEPSAKDISRLNRADIVVRNGLGLEGGLKDSLDRAATNGVAMFTAADHITVRRVGAGEGLPTGDPDQASGAQDPHLWMDPITLVDVMTALEPALAAQGIDAHAGIEAVVGELRAVDAKVAGEVAAVPQADRRLVTGHESLGYFAARYGFTLVGAIVPSLTSQAEVSAADLAALKKAIESQHVRAVFTEVGTPSKVARAIGDETGVQVVELPSHKLPDDGRYATFLLDVATRIATALR
jgi:zinc/manganese transport system substrate-binding protein